MPKVKPWNGMLELETYETSQKSVVQFIDNIRREIIGNAVEIPVPIMYRFYYLGRAYDFQTMKLLKPNGKIILDRVQSLKIGSELELFSLIIKDPIIEHFLKALLPLFETTKEIKGTSIVVVSPTM